MSLYSLCFRAAKYVFHPKFPYFPKELLRLIFRFLRGSKRRNNIQSYYGHLTIPRPVRVGTSSYHYLTLRQVIVQGDQCTSIYTVIYRTFLDTEGNVQQRYELSLYLDGKFATVHVSVYRVLWGLSGGNEHIMKSRLLSFPTGRDVDVNSLIQHALIN